MPIPLTKDMNKFEFEKMINGLFNSPHIKSNATLRLPPASSASVVEVASVFTNIDSFIVERISKYDAVVGCSPWITEGSPIITAVRTKPFHSLESVWELYVGGSAKQIPAHRDQDHGL